MLSLGLILVIVLLILASSLEYKKGPAIKSELSSPGMILESSVFVNNQMIPARHTCDGANVSPPLTVVEVPPEAESLVLIVDDPDAPGGTFVHWLVWDINPQVSEIQEDSVPDGGTEGTNSFGGTSFGGPCPPSGTHSYFFKLYALDTLLGISYDSKKEELLSAMEGHIIAEAEPLLGLYSREKR